jgi:hypothetical protein
MLGPNHQSFHAANQSYNERLEHASRIRMIKKDRHDDDRPFNREGYRLLTARRLAAGLAGAILTVAIAAGAVGTVAASPGQGQGGGITLIR